ncbi:MAG TPA: glycoside hydrolase family 15 protein, partial [Planctomycetaceae bacterium]|nr:glycoside hydrolase family 15 protein [Planctomycetaceae bacterium]
MPEDSQDAPGAPGIPPRWTSSAKSGVGTALNRASRVWFTLSYGILDEVYYGKVDRACTRDLGLIVTAADQFFSEEKRQANSVISYLAEGVPAYRVVNTCREGRYQIEKRFIADPHRDVVLQHIRFSALKGELSDYKLFALLAPHIGNQGADNTGWAGEYKGWPVLFAQRGNVALALACSTPWLKMSAGYVGRSDGWQDLRQHHEMQWTYRRAASGNIALTGQIDLKACNGEFVLALGFGDTELEAGLAACASLNDGFEYARVEYFRHWQEWQSELHPLEAQTSSERDLYRISAAVIRIHESKALMGGIIASLSIPWGASKGDDDLGGYHLIWPRDLVESASALLAAGAPGDLHRILGYLRVTQEADGHWPQNMWVDSRMYWKGVQMDETALVLLLVDLSCRKGILEDRDLRALWPMIRKAAQFLVCNGPVSQEDRWEEDAGYTPFTLAAEIAGLLCAADLADFMREKAIAQYLRETADAWNSSIERWIYISDSPLARQHGVDGYYIRLRPPGADGAEMRPLVRIPNHADDFHIPADKLISPDALALVRFGLRAADDPRIIDTVK